MHGNPFANANAQRGELPFAYPHAGEAFAAMGRDAESSREADEILLQEAEVVVQVASALVEIEDRISCELPGAVVSSLPAAIGFEDGVGEVFAQAGAVASAADGVDGLVLEKDERFLTLTALQAGDKLLLKRESGLKGESTRKKNVHRRRSADGAGNLVV